MWLGVVSTISLVDWGCQSIGWECRASGLGVSVYWMASRADGGDALEAGMDAVHLLVGRRGASDAQRHDDHPRH